MKLSKEARAGLEDAVQKLKTCINGGQKHERALASVGIKGDDILFFLDYLRETKETTLFNWLTKKS